MNYKEIEDYPNYLIYRDGRVWTKNYKRFLTPYKRTRKSDGRQDYIIGLSKNGKRNCFLLSRLLGFAFIPNPLDKIQIDHIDQNPLNNDLSNLRWVTLEEQARNKGLYNNNKLGLRYIYKRKNGSYRVEIPRHKYQKSFKTKEEAILQRNMFLDFMGEDYQNIDV